MPCCVLNDKPLYSITLGTIDLSESPSSTTPYSIGFVKTMHAGVLDANRPMSEQLLFCQMTPALFDAMLACLRHCYVSYSRELGQSSAAQHNSRQTGTFRAVTQKFVELEMELLKSQDSVEISNIQLDVNDTIESLVE
eukprot:931765_1